MSFILFIFIYIYFIKPIIKAFIDYEPPKPLPITLQQQLDKINEEYKERIKIPKHKYDRLRVQECYERMG